MDIKPEYIIRIENKLNQLIDRYKLLKNENETLRNETKEKEDAIAILKKRVKDLERNLEKEIEKNKLSVEKGLAKQGLEKKINEYIKEIDRCIALLGEQD